MRFAVSINLFIACWFVVAAVAEEFRGIYAGGEYHFGDSVIPVSWRIPDGVSGKLTVFDRYRQREFRVLATEGVAGSTELALPFGSYRISWTADGEDAPAIEIPLQVMTQGCDVYDSEAERQYEYLYGVLGGCADFTTPEISEKFGRRWFRYEFPNWASVEKNPGEYDITRMRREAMPWIADNVRPNTLQTSYLKPERYDFFGDPAMFSRGYGRYLQAYAAEVAGLIESHELGNEDNGTGKFLYTEMARQGAAGIRSRQPFAWIGNSGTSHVDLSWMQLQLDRGLFDVLDCIQVHPYTNNSTCSEKDGPEGHRISAQLEQLDPILFAAGGMKELCNTEFGWPNGDADSERARAVMYVRMLVLNDAANLRGEVIYNWDRDYNTVHWPAGVSLHAFARLRQGTRFVGMLPQENDDFYTAVYTGPRGAFAIQWTTREGSFPVKLDGTNLDLFGNPVAQADARVSREISYVVGLADTVVKQAAQAQAQKLAARFQKFLNQNPNSGFDAFRDIVSTDTVALRGALVDWLDSRSEEIGRKEQALFAFALDWYLALGGEFPAPAADGERAFDPRRFRELVTAQNAQSLDIPSLRFLLRQADRLRLRAEMGGAEAAKRDAYLAELALLQRTCEVFAQYGARIQYAVFANLYQKRNGVWSENLAVIPGVPTEIAFRVTSYAPKSCEATVRVLPDQGWNADPVTLRVDADSEAWGTLQVTAPATGTGSKNLSVAVEIAGKPARITTFNTVDFLPALEVEIPTLNKLPGNLPLTFTNRENRVMVGVVKVTPAGVGGAPLAFAPVTIPALGKAECVVNLDEKATRRLAASDYRIDVRVVEKTVRY